MKKVLLLLLCFVASLSAESEVRIMSYNIRHCAGMDSKLNLERTARVIAAQSPDFVGIQEVEYFTNRTGQVDQATELAKAAGLSHGIFGRAIDFSGGQYGVGILSKEEPLSVKNIPMASRSENRTLLVCEFKECVIACTHLSLNEDEIFESAEVLLNEARRWNKPFIIMGDWNIEPQSAFITRMKNDFTFLSNMDELTFPADEPVKCIDYIAIYNPNGKTGLVQNVTSQVIGERVASDHRPVFITADLADIDCPDNFWPDQTEPTAAKTGARRVTSADQLYDGMVIALGNAQYASALSGNYPTLTEQGFLSNVTMAPPSNRSWMGSSCLRVVVPSRSFLTREYLWQLESAKPIDGHPAFYLKNMSSGQYIGGDLLNLRMVASSGAAIAFWAECLNATNYINAEYTTGRKVFRLRSTIGYFGPAYNYGGAFYSSKHENTAYSMIYEIGPRLGERLSSTGTPLSDGQYIAIGNTQYVSRSWALADYPTSAKQGFLNAHRSEQTNVLKWTNGLELVVPIQLALNNQWIWQVEALGTIQDKPSFRLRHVGSGRYIAGSPNNLTMVADPSEAAALYAEYNVDVTSNCANSYFGADAKKAIRFRIHNPGGTDYYFGPAWSYGGACIRTDDAGGTLQSMVYEVENVETDIPRLPVRRSANELANGQLIMIGNALTDGNYGYGRPNNSRQGFVRAEMGRHAYDESIRGLAVVVPDEVDGSYIWQLEAADSNNNQPAYYLRNVATGQYAAIEQIQTAEALGRMTVRTYSADPSSTYSSAYVLSNAFDGDAMTLWHSASGNRVVHTVTVELEPNQGAAEKFVYKARNGKGGGTWKEFELLVKCGNDTDFRSIGTYNANEDDFTLTFDEPIQDITAYRIIIQPGKNGDISAAEIGMYSKSGQALTLTDSKAGAAAFTTTAPKHNYIDLYSTASYSDVHHLVSFTVAGSTFGPLYNYGIATLDATNGKALCSMVYEVPCQNIIIDNHGCGSAVYPFAVAVPEGLTAYTPIQLTTIDAEPAVLIKPYLSAGAILPANTPVIFRGQPGTYVVTPTATTPAAKPTVNLLSGKALESMTCNGLHACVLAPHPNQAGLPAFVPVAQAGVQRILAGRAYLPLSGDAAAQSYRLVIDDNAAGVTDILPEASSDACYDLQGRRVKTPARRSVYIRNGKKMIAQ